MGFQKGDVAVIIGGVPCYLRLTIGALAEISERLADPINSSRENFAAIGPRALSQCLRSLSVAEARVLLTCLLSPPLPARSSLSAQGKEAVSAAAVSDEDMTKLLPAICRVFEQAFSGG